MKMKMKDGTKLNLYVERKVVKLLNSMSKSEGISRSAIVERLVKEKKISSAPPSASVNILKKLASGENPPKK